MTIMFGSAALGRTWIDRKENLGSIMDRPQGEEVKLAPITFKQPGKHTEINTGLVPDTLHTLVRT